MPTLTIDGRSVEVPAGTKVIEAAERVGILIPRFCYHPALGSVGACRVCAVGFLEGPVKGVQMSCMVDAQDGMVVSTTDPEALDFRKHVIEWLMMNHPHDCPVCDEGGQCLLQEETISGGHGVRRYLGRKRTYRDQDLGPFVQHEMNRCIHCYRCRRFYQEFAGGRDLGALQIANHTYFGRFAGGPLESPFSGNLIDLCPTGVFTDKPSRFKGRRWDFERGPSICLECSLGCATTVSARYREVVRVEARFDPDVNGHFLCDRGRYGFGTANAPDRPRRARVDGRETSLDEAIAAAAEALGRFRPSEVACLASARSSEETQEALSGLCRTAGFRGPAFFSGAREAAAAAAVEHLTPDLRVSLRQAEEADWVLVVGADPGAEAPMLALALRQAWRKGARVAVLHAGPVSLPLEFDEVRAGAEELESLLAGVLRDSAAEPLRSFAAALASSRRPLIVCGIGSVEAAAAAAAGLRAAGRDAGLLCLLPGANAFGAASRGATTWPSSAAGAVGVVAVEADVVGALGVAAPEVLVCLDHRFTDTARAARVFLPTATVFEVGGRYRNHEGRARDAHAVCRGGTPISQLSGGGHPPREFRADVPGGDPRPVWELVGRLGRLLCAQEAIVSP